MAEAEEIGPMTAIRQFVTAFNDNDHGLVAAACAEEVSIIDDFPPYLWTGRGATTRWFGDMERMSAEFGMADPSVTLIEPLQVIVSDAGAYVVAPVDVRWRERGTPAQRTGFLTAALREEADGWRISGCTWTWN